MPTERPLDLMIFDCDGVLVDSERLTVEIEARVLTEMGWPISTGEILRRFVGRSSEFQLAEVALRFGPERAAEFDRVTTDEIVAAFRSRLLAVDGVTSLVEDLHEMGVATCVASSGSHRKMNLTLGLTGLYEKFAGRVFSGDEVAMGKPEPDLFLHAAASMGFTPDRCAVIEDSVYGVRAAVSAEMLCYGFAGGLTERADLESAGAILFDAMAELADMITV